MKYSAMGSIKKDSKAEEKSLSEPKDIRRVGNKVYFHAQVTQEAIASLLDEVFAADRELSDLYSFPYIKAPEDYSAPPTIIEINSPGGEIVETLRYLDKVEEIERPIWTIVSGFCASAGTMIAMPADYRLMYPRSYYLVHSMSSASWGKYETMEDEMAFIKELQNQMVDLYMKSNTKNLSEDQLRALMARERALTADEALEYGFIDKIIGRN